MSIKGAQATHVKMSILQFLKIANTDYKGLKELSGGTNVCKGLYHQVLQQWMSVIRAPPTQQAPPAPSPRVTVSYFAC